MIKKSALALTVFLMFVGCNLNNQITDPGSTQNPFVVILASPTNHTTSGSAISVSGSSYNKSGLKSAAVYYCLTNSGSPTNSVTAQTSGDPLVMIAADLLIESSGYYHIWLKALDNNKRTAASPKVLVHAVVEEPDTTPPTLTVSSHTNNQIVGKTFTLQGTVSDNREVADILFRINQNAWFSIATLSANWQQSITLTNTGINTLALYSLDASGNSSLTQSLNLNYDSSVPTLSITSPHHGIMTNVTTLNVTGTASVQGDTIQSVSLSLNGGAYQNVGNTVWYKNGLTLSQGSNTIKARAVSTGGKTADTSIALYVDSIKPVLNVTSPTEGYTVSGNSANITVAGTVTETGSGIQGVYLSTGGDYVKISSSQNWSSIINLPADDYTLSLYSKDLAGNTSSTQNIHISITNKTTVGLTVHFKNTANWPTVNIHYWNVIPAQPATGWPGLPMHNDGNGWWSYTITNAQIANLLFHNTKGTQTADLGRTNEGWYVLSENTWYDQDPDDTVPPTIHMTAPASNALLQGVVTLSASASDDKGVVKVEFYYDNVLIASDSTAPYSIQWNSAYSPSTGHNLTAKAYDLANSSVSVAVPVTTSNPNLPPVADAGKDITILPGGLAKFNGSKSSDPNGTIVSWQWSNGLTGETPSMVYNSVGTNTVTLTVTDNNGATATDTVKVFVVTKIPHNDFREETIYFIMTDRFADGNPNNNEIWGGESTTDIYNIYDQSKTGVLSYYHGGDFQGIIDNLDYIKSMGFTAIWITPVVKQPEGRHSNGGDYSASPFHGYWGYDFDKIDPHLHNSGKNSDGWADFDALVEAVHDKDMKLMLDIVVNHGHPTAVAVNSPTYATRNTVIMDGQTWTWESGDPYWNASQTPHTDGFFSYYNGVGLVDLIDFNEHGTQNAVPHLKNVYKKFIDHGVDAFRIDTVAYMSAGFWQNFTREMKTYASNQGNDHFYMCGEAWTGDRTAAVGLIYNGGQNKSFNMLDLHGSSMDFPGWMGNAFKGQTGFNNGNGWLRISGNDGDKSGKYDPTWLSTFVDNHDVTRANGILSLEQYMNNLTYIYLFRGIPIVYYGTEIMYSSWPNYITTTDKNDVVARWMLGSSGINYVKNNQPALYKHIKMLNSLRHSSVALQKGQQTDLEVGVDNIVFKRDAGVNVAFVALTKGAGFSTTISGIPNGTYRLITPNSANGTYNSSSITISSGSYSLSVPANSFVILDK